MHDTDLINQISSKYIYLFYLVYLSLRLNLEKLVFARGEHLMLFLAKTVGRQMVEQEQCRRSKTKSQGLGGV